MRVRVRFASGTWYMGSITACSFAAGNTPPGFEHRKWDRSWALSILYDDGDFEEGALYPDKKNYIQLLPFAYASDPPLATTTSGHSSEEVDYKRD